MDGDECEPRTKLPARKSLFSSKPITAYGLDEYPPTDIKLTQHLPKQEPLPSGYSWFCTSWPWVKTPVEGLHHYISPTQETGGKSSQKNAFRYTYPKASKVTIWDPAIPTIQNRVLNKESMIISFWGWFLPNRIGYQVKATWFFSINQCFLDCFQWNWEITEVGHAEIIIAKNRRGGQPWTFHINTVCLKISEIKFLDS